MKIEKIWVVAGLGLERVFMILYCRSVEERADIAWQRLWCDESGRRRVNLLNYSKALTIRGMSGFVFESKFRIKVDRVNCY